MVSAKSLLFCLVLNVLTHCGLLTHKSGSILAQVMACRLPDGTKSLHEHYNDVIMGAIASQITSLTIVYSTVYSGADQRKHKAPRHRPLCGEFTEDR